MTESADLTTDEARQIARLELEYLLPLQNVLIDEHSASYRWIMASLLAINAGGLLAVKDTISRDPSAALLAGIFFFLGIGFALLIAVLGQRSNQKAIPPISNVCAALMAAVVTGEYDHKRIEQEKAAYSGALKGSWMARACGWLSFGMFSAALISLVIRHP